MKNVILSLILVFGFLGAQASETFKGVKKDFESFKQEMLIQLNATENKIDELKVKAQNRSSVAQEKSIVEYEQTRDKIKAQLDDLEKSSKRKWLKVKSRLAESINKLNKKVQKSLEE